MKLALGTVQFGLNYGISNKNGKINLSEIEKILTFARQENINVLDTAQAYGDAETVLGKFDLSNFKIVTKIFDDGILENSLERLRLSSVYAVMFHRENQVNDKTWAYFASLKRQKLVSKIGVSVYSPAVLKQLINEFPIDIVQIPVNIFDFRFVSLFEELKAKNIEVHTRSAFLQGLLFMDPENLNPYFHDIKNVIARIPEPKINSALHCLKAFDEIDRIVVGVSCLEDLRGICKAYNAKPDKNQDLTKFHIDDEKYINPANWPKQ